MISLVEKVSCFRWVSNLEGVNRRFLLNLWAMIIAYEYYDYEWDQWVKYSTKCTVLRKLKLTNGYSVLYNLNYVLLFKRINTSLFYVFIIMCF